MSALIVVLTGVTIDDLSRPMRRTWGGSDATAATPCAQVLNPGLPAHFTSPADWPQSCTLECRICGQIPMGPPRLVPTCRFNSHEGAIVYAVVGPFHEWCCAARYIDIYYPATAHQLHLYLTEIEAMFSGKPKLKIPAAGCPFMLKKYKGDEHGVTYEQWNRQNDEKTAREQILSSQ